MGLELYPSSENSMLTSQNALLASKEGALKNTEVALQCFVDDTSLQGQAYLSAKALASRAAIPAVRGIAVLCQSAKSSNTTVNHSLGSYVWSGAGHLSEDNLSAQSDSLIYQINQISGMEHAELFASNISSLQNINSSIQNRISEMHTYNSQTANAYTQGNEIQDIILGVQGALAAIDSATFNSDTLIYSFEGVDFSFESKLSGVSSLVGEAEQNAIAFYHSLPSNLKAALSVNDLEATSDGFVMCSKPMDQIFKDMGIEGLSAEDAAFLESVFLWGLRKSDGTFEHSIIQMRIPGDSSDAGLISVPFRTLDISFFNNLTSDNTGKLTTEFRDILTSDKLNNANDFLLSYFCDPESEGSYLIANIAIKRALDLAGISGEGVWKPDTMDTIMKSDPSTAKALEKYQKMGLIDIESSTVFIKDSNNLSFDEKSAILACITSSPDLYAYAAENQFHAHLFQNNPPLPKIEQYIGERAIVSDAGVGESTSFYEAAFKESIFEGELLDGIWDKTKAMGFSVFNYGVPYYDQQVAAQTAKGLGGPTRTSGAGNGFGGGGGGAR